MIYAIFLIMRALLKPKWCLIDSLRSGSEELNMVFFISYVIFMFEKNKFQCFFFLGSKGGAEDLGDDKAEFNTSLTIILESSSKRFFLPKNPKKCKE